MNIGRISHRTLTAVATAALLAAPPAHPRLAAQDDGFLLAPPQLAWAIATQGDAALLRIREEWRTQWVSAPPPLTVPDSALAPEPVETPETLVAGAV